MKIVVCLSDGGPSEIDALRSAGAWVDADVIALTVGGDESSELLRTACANGAASGVRVDVEALSLLDFHGMGEVIAAAAQRLGADLVLCGSRTQEEGLGAIPATTARYLGATFLSCADELAVAPETGHLLCTVRGGGRRRRVRVRLPAVISVLRARPGSPDAVLAPAAADAALEVLSLGEIGLLEARLRRRDDLLGWMQAPGREHAVVRTVSELAALLR